eukprot:554835-Rhodomonas_salina.4
MLLEEVPKVWRRFQVAAMNDGGPNGWQVQNDKDELERELMERRRRQQLDASEASRERGEQQGDGGEAVVRRIPRALLGRAEREFEGDDVRRGALTGERGREGEREVRGGGGGGRERESTERREEDWKRQLRAWDDDLESGGGSGSERDWHSHSDIESLGPEHGNTQSHRHGKRDIREPFRSESGQREPPRNADRGLGDRPEGISDASAHASDPRILSSHDPQSRLAASQHRNVGSGLGSGLEKRAGVVFDPSKDSDGMKGFAKSLGRSRSDGDARGGGGGGGGTTEKVIAAMLSTGAEDAYKRALAEAEAYLEQSEKGFGTRGESGMGGRGGRGQKRGERERGLGADVIAEAREALGPLMMRSAKEMQNMREEVQEAKKDRQRLQGEVQSLRRKLEDVEQKGSEQERGKQFGKNYEVEAVEVRSLTTRSLES